MYVHVYIAGFFCVVVDLVVVVVVFKHCLLYVSDVN